MKTKISSLIIFILFSTASMAQVNKKSTFVKRGHKILCSAYSPDGKYIATGGVDDKIIIWDTQTGNIIKEIINRDWPLALKFTPNGNYLVSAGRTERVRVWDYKTGKMVREMKGHRDHILALDISPDGKYIATGSIDKMVKLWDLEQGVFIKDLKGHRDQVSSVAFSPDGKKLASSGADKSIKEWNIPQGDEIRTIQNAHKGWVRNVAYSPNGKLLASGGDDKKINLWKDGVLQKSLLGHKHILQSISFSGDGNYLLSGGYDNFFILWEVETGKIMYASDRQADKVLAVHFSPDGKCFITSDFTYDLNVWDISNLGIASTQIAQNTHAEKQSTPLVIETPVQKKTEPHKIPVTNQAVSSLDIDVDQIKPMGIKPNPNRYALIFGNEDYSSFQTSLRSESDVDFAIRDAELFKQYAIYVLGVPEENIVFNTNARAIQMHRDLNKINMITNITKGNAEIFFYYAGHGFPDEKTQDPYIIPVDVSGSDLEFALKLSDVYAKLTEYPSLRVTVFLDACFSGGARNQGLVAARGVKIKPKENVFRGNMVVFAASSGDQSSLPYKEKQHGMFTYFLLKKLQESKGDVTYKELSDYLREQVGVKSILINNKEQIPETNISIDIKNTWSSLKVNP